MICKHIKIFRKYSKPAKIVAKIWNIRLIFQEILEKYSEGIILIKPNLKVW